ncbi:TonB-dependent receptor [Polymorphobacter sp.]|uniref:TonB-dependent receptor n=1 Tax=Polymorphobacter sp. TaxID=1909290 RepID=UPI003F6F5AAA
MTIRSKTAFAVSSLALATALLMPGAARAAEDEAAAAAAAAIESEEIIVTAKGRPERIENVALSVVAVDQEFLRKQQVRDLRDLAGFVPSLVLESSRGRASPSTLSIRGLAPNTINKQLQSVTVFLDGVPLAGSASMLDIPDIAGVEVLRGPQATEFGRQTYAGAVSYKTRDRTPDGIEAVIDGFVSINQGAEEANRQISATIAFPIVKDNVWLTLFGRNRRLGSLESRTNALRTIEIGREDTEQYNASLLIRPNNQFSLKLTGVYQKQRDTAPAFTTLHPQEWQAQGTPLTNLQYAGTTATTLWPIGTLGEVEPASAGCESDLPANATNTIAARPADCGLDRNLMLFTAVTSYTFGNGYQLQANAGYMREESWTNQDLYFRQSGGDPFFGNQAYSRRVSNTATAANKLANPFFSSTWDEFTNYNGQIRIVSPGTDRFRWRAGAFYYHESLSNFSYNNVRPTAGGATSPANPDGRTRGDENVRNIAFFGDMAFDFTDWLSLQTEARYEFERNQFLPCLTCSGATTGAFNSTLLERTNKSFLPRITLSLKPSDSTLVYALYSEGTKPGRWNQTIQTNFRYVEQESNRNYEIGIKGRILDNKLFFSAAAYHMDVENQQFAAVSTATGIPVTSFQNVGASKIDGFEIDTTVDVTPGFRLRGGVGYAKHKYVSNTAPTDANLINLFQGSTFNGKTSVGLPQWTGSIGADYDTSLTDDIGLRLSVFGNYIGERFADAANLARIAGVVRINANANIDYKNLSFGFFVRDLFDNNKASTAATSDTNSCLYFNNADGSRRLSLNPEQRCLAVGIDRGREVGLNVTLRFE